MTLKAEWRTKGDSDSVLIVKADDNTVRQALAADSRRLKLLLTNPGDLSGWEGDVSIDEQGRDPASWGALVIARADSGEIIWMDPDRFWGGVYSWFRSRGVDYNSDDSEGINAKYANLSDGPLFSPPEGSLEEIEDIPGFWFGGVNPEKRR